MISPFSNELDQEEYAALLRALQWLEGFGVFFVECTPVQSQQLINHLRKELSDKRISIFQLDDEIKDLRQTILDIPDCQNIQLLFLSGLEKSFEPYIKSGHGGEGDYYKEDSVPPILGRLNLDRETFKQDFPHLALVLMLPPFGIKYFIRRATDFFDWRSGFFSFKENNSYDTLDNYDNVLFSLGRKEEAIESYNKVLVEKSEEHDAWLNRGYALWKLGRFEEAIENYDQWLAIKPDAHEAWNNRGIALRRLGRFEEAIKSYNQAIEIKPDKHEAWFNRGYALRQLGRKKEAVESYDKALEIKPDGYWIWDRRGITLWKQGKLCEAAKSFARALEIKFDDLSSLGNDIELALAQNDLSRMGQHLTVALPLLKPNMQEFVILPFLQWLAQLIESPQIILDKIQQLDPNVEITWDFSELPPVIQSLTLEQQSIARSFIDFFQKKVDFETLQRLISARYPSKIIPC